MQKSNDPALFWIGLSSIPGVGRVTFRKLAHYFGSPERALAASRDELSNAGLSERVIADIASLSWREHAEKELVKARDAGVLIITADDTAYPPELRNTPDPPLFLYVKGSLRHEEGVAIVGTRKPTHYGLTVTHRISYELAAAGLAVVSGLARGIDTQAHRGALAAKGRTIAVLGCGIDIVYPPENRGLLELISGNGAVVTENPFGTKPEAGYFPARNRIISGLSRGTVIIEATEDSGSLITANYTIEQGKKLFAVPGNIGSPNSRGTNSLIKRGAVLVEGADDILRNFGIKRPGADRERGMRPLPALTPEEDCVLRCITTDPRHIDIIMNGSRLAAGKLSGVLITLELKGLVKQLPGKYYMRED
jgi:DNA processing protein